MSEIVAVGMILGFCIFVATVVLYLDLHPIEKEINSIRFKVDDLGHNLTRARNEISFIKIKVLSIENQIIDIDEIEERIKESVTEEVKEKTEKNCEEFSVTFPLITDKKRQWIEIESKQEGEGSVVGYLGMGEFYIGEIYYLDFDSDLSEEDMLELIHEGKRVLRLNNIDESKFRIYYDDFF